MEEIKHPNWTIDELYDFESGKCIKVGDFLANYNLDNEEDQDKLIKLRYELEKSIQNKIPPKYGCWYCKGLAALRAVKSDKRRIYFKALHHSDCKVKSKNLSKEQILRIKYNGQQESRRHVRLKNKIAELLELNKQHKKEIHDIIIDKPRKLSTDDESNEWKRPDIFALYKKENCLRKIAFELQLTTTFLDVVISRQDFYKRDESYIIWVFNDFSTERKNQRMMQLDIIVSNNMNAFVINDKTIEESFKNNDLLLLCFYKTYKRIGNKIESTWNEQLISLNDLQFTEDFEVFYYNSDAEYNTLNNNIISEQKAIKIQKRKDLERKLIEKEKLKIAESKQIEFTGLEKDIYELVNEIRKVYKVKSYSEIPYWLIKKIDELSSEGANILNDKLKFKKENLPFITNLVRNGEHLTFLKFLLKSKHIELELNEYDKESGTLLSEYLLKYKDEQVCEVIELFVNNGYKLKGYDKKFIACEYPFNDFKTDKSIDNYFANILIKLGRVDFIQKVNKSSKLRKFILAVLSVKYNMVIYWHYKNFRSLANQVFYKYKEYAFLFDKAIKHYKRIDGMIAEDKKKQGKFRNKLNEFYQKNINDIEDSDILQIVFPDLF